MDTRRPKRKSVHCGGKLENPEEAPWWHRENMHGDSDPGLTAPLCCPTISYIPLGNDGNVWSDVFKYGFMQLCGLRWCQSQSRLRYCPPQRTEVCAGDEQWYRSTFVICHISYLRTFVVRLWCIMASNIWFLKPFGEVHYGKAGIANQIVTILTCYWDHCSSWHLLISASHGHSHENLDNIPSLNSAQRRCQLRTLDMWRMVL